MKKNYMVIDLEGCQSKGAYQLGYAVYNTKKGIIKSDYFNIKSMLKKYEHSKIQKREDVKNVLKKKTKKQVENTLLDIIEKYKIKTIYTYNYFSDKVTLEKTFSKNFIKKLNKKCQFVDLMVLSVENIVKTQKYIKVHDINNNMVKHKVEVVYTYIIGNEPLIECHNAENDSILECEILKYLIDNKLDKNKEYNSLTHMWNSIRKYIKNEKANF